jgi:hypothetical protein
LKESAQGFYEGALSNRMLGPLGGLLLREGGVTGRAIAETPATAGIETKASTPAGVNAAAAEMDVRLDSADLVSLRDAVTTAMTQALLAAPPGGYKTQDDALATVRSALASVPLAGSPTGMAAGDPRMGDYLDRRATPIASHILLTSQSRAPLASDETQPAHTTNPNRILPPDSSDSAGRSKSIHKGER